MSCKIYNDISLMVRVFNIDLERMEYFKEVKNGKHTRMHAQSHISDADVDANPVTVNVEEAVVGVSYGILDKGNMKASDSDSFYDSDDVLTDESVKFDSLADFQHPLSSYDFDPNMKVHSVYIDEFSFRPSHLTCKVGEAVRFVLEYGMKTCSLICEDEFESITLSSAVKDTYIHQFKHTGIFEVKNEIFNFVGCTVHVSFSSPSVKIKQSAPKLFGSFSSTVAGGRLPTKPVFNLALNGEGDKANNIQKEEKQSISPERLDAIKVGVPLFGSFPVSRPVANVELTVKEEVLSDLSDNEDDREYLQSGNMSEGSSVITGGRRKVSRTAKKRKNKRKRLQAQKQVSTQSTPQTENGCDDSTKESNKLSMDNASEEIKKNRDMQIAYQEAQADDTIDFDEEYSVKEESKSQEEIKPVVEVVVHQEPNVLGEQLKEEEVKAIVSSPASSPLIKISSPPKEASAKIYDEIFEEDFLDSEEDDEARTIEKLAGESNFNNGGPKQELLQQVDQQSRVKLSQSVVIKAEEVENPEKASGEVSIVGKKRGMLLSALGINRQMSMYTSQDENSLEKVEETIEKASEVSLSQIKEDQIEDYQYQSTEADGEEERSLGDYFIKSK